METFISWWFFGAVEDGKLLFSVYSENTMETFFPCCMECWIITVIRDLKHLLKGVALGCLRVSVLHDTRSRSTHRGIIDPP